MRKCLSVEYSREMGIRLQSGILCRLHSSQTITNQIDCSNLHANPLRRLARKTSQTAEKQSLRSHITQKIQIDSSSVEC